MLCILLHNHFTFNVSSCIGHYLQLFFHFKQETQTRALKLHLGSQVQMSAEINKFLFKSTILVIKEVTC